MLLYFSVMWTGTFLGCRRAGMRYADAVVQVSSMVSRMQPVMMRAWHPGSLLAAAESTAVRSRASRLYTSTWLPFRRVEDAPVFARPCGNDSADFHSCYVLCAVRDRCCVVIDHREASQRSKSLPWY